MKAQQTSQEWQGIEEEDSWRDRMPLGCSGRAGGGGGVGEGGGSVVRPGTCKSDLLICGPW